MREFAIDEIVLRKFEKPRENEELDKLIKKFCISLGLMQEGESRNVIVDILKFLLEKKKKFERANVKEIVNYLKEKRNKGITEQNVRWHLRKLIKLGIVEKTGREYRIKEFLTLEELIDDLLKFKVYPIIERIKEIAKEIDKKY